MSRIRILLVFAAIFSSSCILNAPKKARTAAKGGELILIGDSRDLRRRADNEPPNSPEKPGILLLLVDGVDRPLLYDMLDKKELPGLAGLLGGEAHVHRNETLLSTLPSSTMVAWATTLTGVGPAEHGITGNELFIRTTGKFAAPVPVTIDDHRPVLSCFIDDYADNLRTAPSVYERLRKEDPNILIWVAMHQFHPGADRLLLTNRGVILKAFEGFIEETVEKTLSQKQSREVFEELDEAVMDVVLSEIEDEILPDVLTVYLSGADSFAHVADDGPDKARRTYLKEVIDPLYGKLAAKLKERGALENRYIILTADHGHTEVMRDDTHSLSVDGEDEPPMVLEKAGFRVRPFKLDVSDDHDFSAVLAYQGAMAYVYLADRTTCPEEGKKCDWTKPPRFEEDVLMVAEAFHQNNLHGRDVAGMKGTLDMILAREPMPYAEKDKPFQVYIGEGKLVPIGDYLRDNPRPEYVAFEERMKDLAAGTYGERAGDIILIAQNGGKKEPSERYYFAGEYRSWHGSPSKADSEIPLIVAHPRKSKAELEAITKKVLGREPFQQKVTDLILTLRNR